MKTSRLFRVVLALALLGVGCDEAILAPEAAQGCPTESPVLGTIVTASGDTIQIATTCDPND